MDTATAEHAPKQSALKPVEAPKDQRKKVELDADTGGTVGKISHENAKMTCRGVDVFYGDKQAIKQVNLDIGANEVIALIGPSGCGKSTFLRALNRMNDTVDGCRVTGTIHLDGEDIYDKRLDVVQLRARVGMVGVRLR